LECAIGLDFVQLLSDQEDACEAETRRRISDLGPKISVCLVDLGTLLSLLDRAASCFWGCHGGNHVAEQLACRVCSCARAALRLLLFGLYDESLSITRSIGETANLMLLLTLDQAALAHWGASTPRQRQERFGPDIVRLRLEALNLPVFITEACHAESCEAATHAAPHLKAQADNTPGAPVVGAQFQEAGVVVALTELATALAWASIPLPKLLRCDDRRGAEINDAAAALAAAAGSADIVAVKELHAAMWRQAVEDAPSVGEDHSPAWRATLAPAIAPPSSERPQQRPRRRRRRTTA
jgi:hypothetical protein